MEKIYIVHHVKLEDGISDAMDNVRDYVFKDIDIAKEFINKYKVEKDFDILSDFQYGIDSKKGEYQYLILKEYNINKGIPSLKYNLE